MSRRVAAPQASINFSHCKMRWSEQCHAVFRDSWRSKTSERLDPGRKEDLAQYPVHGGRENCFRLCNNGTTPKKCLTQSLGCASQNVTARNVKHGFWQQNHLRHCFCTFNLVEIAWVAGIGRPGDPRQQETASTLSFRCPCFGKKTCFAHI